MLQIEALSVGHYSDFEGMTGCTVVLAPQGVTASVDIRGGAPGSIDTALLSPMAAVGECHGILLTGGSAPGLRAAAGVVRYLREQKVGYETTFARIPLVAGAVIYDLGLGRPDAFPGPDDAYEAAARASALVEEGSVGVGTGATVGKVAGHDTLMKGGVGVSTVRVRDGATVTALSVVNAVGDVIDEHGRVLAGARRDGAFLDSHRLLLEMHGAPSLNNQMENTTLSVVMTDARFDKVQCAMVARMSHDGMARAIDPVHTPVDGDCIFVLATGCVPANVFQVGTAAAEAVAASIRRAVRVAEGAPGAPALRDLGL
jgi:L-aminopeptidase/D-esterase-like protein